MKTIPRNYRRATPKFGVTRSRSFWALQAQRRNRERRAGDANAGQIIGENDQSIYGENDQPINV